MNWKILCNNGSVLPNKYKIKMLFSDLQSVIEPVIHSVLKKSSIKLFIKREDVLHPFLSGNKYRKLKYNLLEMYNRGFTKLLTFGGAYSNHILAVAIAGFQYKIPSIGIVRGEELAENIPRTLKKNPTLAKAYQLGMRFEFISRKTYRNKNDPFFLKTLQNKYPKAYMLPEGGTNSLAIRGCEEILDSACDAFDFIATPLGTGGTFIGLVNTIKTHQKVLGFSALKAKNQLENVSHYKSLKKGSNAYKIFSEDFFGGYAKFNKDLIDFLNDFKSQTNILLDPIYNGKMMYRILDLIKNNYFSPNTKILAIHTGGLQGMAGFNERLKRKKLPQIIT